MRLSIVHAINISNRFILKQWAKAFKTIIIKSVIITIHKLYMKVNIIRFYEFFIHTIY